MHTGKLNAKRRRLGPTVRAYPHGQALDNEIAGLAYIACNMVRIAAVAGQKAPEPAVHHDRYRHGGERAHVAHIFEMDRGHAAQLRECHVDGARIPFLAERNERYRFIIRIGDQAYAVEAIEVARLCRNIGSGSC